MPTLNRDLAGRHPWQQVETEYDGQGQIAWRKIVYDDGRERVLEFVDGVLWLDTVTDGGGPSPCIFDCDSDPAGPTPVSIGNDVFEWHSVTTEYDGSGRVGRRTTVQDDGRVRAEYFDAGRKTYTVETDNLDAHGWAEKATIYDNGGNVAWRTTLYDNGDAQVLFYYRGVLVERQILDGDDDKGWHVVRVQYGPEREVVDRIVFADGDPLPDDVLVPGFVEPLPPPPVTPTMPDFGEHGDAPSGDFGSDVFFG